MKPRLHDVFVLRRTVCSEEIHQYVEKKDRINDICLEDIGKKKGGGGGVSREREICHYDTQ
jgi:hypothetical protein